MSSVIFRTAARFLLPLLLLFSIFVLLRGHDDPGGGFVGGLLAAGGFAVYALAHGPQSARRALCVDPRTLVAAGLLAAGAAALAGVLGGQPPLTGLWAPDPLPGIGKVSTVLLFDVGVYLVVMGATLVILLNLAED